jgi:hypothetical protein
MMKWIIAAVAFYGGVVALLYVAQRSLQYFPERRRTVPRAIGLPEAEEAVSDGHQTSKCRRRQAPGSAWCHPPPEGWRFCSDRCSWHHSDRGSCRVLEMLARFKKTHFRNVKSVYFAHCSRLRPIAGVSVPNWKPEVAELNSLMIRKCVFPTQSELSASTGGSVPATRERS